MGSARRGARILLTDDKGVRADMTASWLAQMGFETYVLNGGYDGALEIGPPMLPKPDAVGQHYPRPYEGTMSMPAQCRPISNWEYGLVETGATARRGFFVI